jgi:dTMP kinase
MKQTSLLIALEGLDGAGKSTQVHLLQKYFEAQSVESVFLHFPRFDAPVYGELIAAFLRGEFGAASEVSPKLVALLYAGDRHTAAPTLKQWLDGGKVVILDRYVHSNIAFQCAKIDDPQERCALKEWILHLEFEFFGIPRPDAGIFLDVPPDFTLARLREQRQGADRDYLKGKNDIHESDFELQRRVREMYLEMSAADSDGLICVNCADNSSAMRPASEIHREIVNKITGQG